MQSYLPVRLKNKMHYLSYEVSLVGVYYPILYALAAWLSVTCVEITHLPLFLFLFVTTFG